MLTFEDIAKRITTEKYLYIPKSVMESGRGQSIDIAGVTSEEFTKKTGVKVFMHICGDTMDRLEMLAATEVDGLSLDSKVDFAIAREKLGPDYLLIGNVDPTNPLALGTPELVFEHCKKVIEQAGLEGHFILSAGCQVPEETPPQNMEAMIKAARDVGSY